MPKIKFKDDPANLALGEYITLRREAANYTQAQLALKLRITYKQLDRYERGIDMVPIDTLERIGELLYTPVPKKLVRQIMKIRVLAPEDREEYEEELCALYREAFEIEEEEIPAYC